MSQKKLLKYCSIVMFIYMIFCNLQPTIAYAAAVHTRRDSPRDFNELLGRTSWSQRKSLVESLGGDTSKASDIGYIRKELVYRAYNKLSYLFRSDKEVDYHAIVQWAAKKNGIDSYYIDYASTFDLERKITEKYLGDIWDKLTPDQRREVLNQMEKDTGTISNKTGILSMSGASAIAAISAAVAAKGFAFYVGATTLLHAIGVALGTTFAFSTYTALTSTIAVLGGPVGWVIGGVMAVGGAALMGLPEKDKVSAFVMNINAIKTELYGDK